MSDRVTNNQGHELRLWEIFLARLDELESLGGLGRLNVEEVFPDGFSITIEGVDYVISLSPTEYPLRVTIAQGDGQQETLFFENTRAILLAAIAEIEGQICWIEWGKERWARIENEDQWGDREEEEDEEEIEPQAHYLGNKGDVCGFVIYE